MIKDNQQKKKAGYAVSNSLFVYTKNSIHNFRMVYKILEWYTRF